MWIWCYDLFDSLSLANSSLASEITVAPGAPKNCHDPMLLNFNVQMGTCSSNMPGPLGWGNAFFQAAEFYQKRSLYLVYSLSRFLEPKSNFLSCLSYVLNPLFVSHGYRFLRRTANIWHLSQRCSTYDWVDGIGKMDFGEVAFERLTRHHLAANQEDPKLPPLRFNNFR